MPNIEIKAKYPNLETAKNIAKEIRAKRLGLDRQVDTYFRTPSGRLKLRESSLSGAQLIPYLRPDQKQAKKSQYVLIPIHEARVLKTILGQILGQETVVTKDREIFLYENVRIHLDRVEGLGSFFELEAVYDSDNPSASQAQTEKVEYLVEKFQISKSDLITGSYGEMKH